MTSAAGPGPPPLCVLFCNTFNRGRDVHEVMFSSSVVVKQIRVIRQNERPHPNNLRFTGQSWPRQFEFQVFGLDLARPSSRYKKLTPKIWYQESDNSCTYKTSDDIVTDHIIIRGDYDSCSLCVYGFAANFRPQQKHKGEGSSKRDMHRSDRRDRDSARDRDRDHRDKNKSSTKSAAKKSPAAKPASKSPLVIPTPVEMFPASVVDKVIFEPWNAKSYELLHFLQTRDSDALPDSTRTELDGGFGNLVEQLCTIPTDAWSSESLLPVLSKVDKFVVGAGSRWLAPKPSTNGIKGEAAKEDKAAQSTSMARLMDALLRILDKRPSAAVMKATFSLLSRLLTGYQPTRHFVEYGGLRQFYSILLNDRHLSSSIKEACLHALTFALHHPRALERFLEYSEEYGCTGYQLVLNMITYDRSPPARVLFAAKQVLKQPLVYESSSVLRSKVKHFFNAYPSVPPADESECPPDFEKAVLGVCLAVRQLLRVLGSESPAQSKTSKIVQDQSAGADRSAWRQAVVEQERAQLKATVLDREDRAQGLQCKPPVPLLQQVRSIPRHCVRHLQDSKLLNVLVALLNYDFGSWSELRNSVLGEVRDLLMFLCATYDGLRFMCSDLRSLRHLLHTLDYTTATKPADKQKATAFPPLVPAAIEPSLLACQLTPSLATGPVLAAKIIRKLRSLLLVRCAIQGSVKDADVRMAAMYFLQLMTVHPSGADAVAWALYRSDAVGNAKFQQLLSPAGPPLMVPQAGTTDFLSPLFLPPSTSSTPSSTPPASSPKAPSTTKSPALKGEGEPNSSSTKSSKKPTTASAYAQFTVSLLLTLAESRYFPLVASSLTKQMYSHLSAMADLKSPSRTFKTQLAQLMARVEPALALADKGVRACMSNFFVVLWSCVCVCVYLCVVHFIAV